MSDRSGAGKRATKPTSKLGVGDVVVLPDGEIRTVTHTQRAEQEGPDRILVVFDDASAKPWPADKLWELATEAEIAAARRETKAEDMARALDHLAALIRQRRLPPALYSIDVGLSVNTIAELQEWADALKHPVTQSGGNGSIPVIRADDTARYGDVRLDVRVQSMELFPTAEEGPAQP